MIITVVGLGVVGGSFVKALKVKVMKFMGLISMKRLYKWRKMKEL